MLLTPATPKLNLELPEPKHPPLPFHLTRTEIGRKGVWAQKNVHLNYLLYIRTIPVFLNILATLLQMIASPFQMHAIQFQFFYLYVSYCSWQPLVSLIIIVIWVCKSTRRPFESKNNVTTIFQLNDLMFTWMDYATQASFNSLLTDCCTVQTNGNQWLSWKTYIEKLKTARFVKWLV